MKKILNVKKFIKKKLIGGRLKELNPPKENSSIESNKNLFFNLNYVFFNRPKNFLFFIKHLFVIF